MNSGSFTARCLCTTSVSISWSISGEHESIIVGFSLSAGWFDGDPFFRFLLSCLWHWRWLPSAPIVDAGDIWLTVLAVNFVHWHLISARFLVMSCTSVYQWSRCGLSSGTSFCAGKGFLLFTNCSVCFPLSVSSVGHVLVQRVPLSTSLDGWTSADSAWLSWQLIWKRGCMT